MKKMFFAILIFCIFFAGCTGKKSQAEYDLSVLVFITGIVAGSPPYELLAQGASEFASLNPNVNVKIYETGFNQAMWEQQLAEMVLDGEYDVVIGSNPSLSEICANVGRMFPDVKFIITDAYYEGNQQIKTYLFNQYEQSLFLGYLAALVTNSEMPNTNSQKKIGFIAAQEYPILTRQIIPGFIDGARLVDPQIELDRRIVGSWGDAAKAAELTSAMMDAGVDVFTAIAGGAAQGMVRTAADRGAYVVWYNTNVYALAPGIIVGCGIMHQKKLVMEILEQAMTGEIEYGVSETVGIKEGYIDFIYDDPHFQDSLPDDIRVKFMGFLDDLRIDRIEYTVPAL